MTPGGRFARPLLARSLWGRAPAVGALLLAPCPAPGLELALQLGAVRQEYRSTERLSSGAIFNREAGTLGGPQGGVALRAGPWSVALVAQRADGTLRYDGQTQAGFPLQTRTHLRHTASSMHLARGFWNDVLEVAVGGGRRDLDRRIRPTPPGPQSPFGSQGLNERLQSTEWRFAARAHWPVGAGARLGAEGEWLRNVDARLRVDTLGLFDTAQVRVPDWSGWATRLAWTQALARHCELRMQYEWHRFDPPASGLERLTRDGRDAGASLVYPGSEQRIRTWLVQVTATF